MTSPMPHGTGATPQRCPSCGGQWIDGRIAMPIVGGLRFTYRLGTNEVTTEVAARMCKDCGYVELRAREPDLISRAAQASAQARPPQRWALRAHRSAGGYRSRYGQE
jgi:predicted Zn-ribbon and HTH transcriptional regulator